MINKAPRNINTPERIIPEKPLTKKDTLKDTVSVKDSNIYQIQKWQYLVKKQTIGGKDKLITWFAELADQGWEIINGQQNNLGFYIFKKASK